jgi:hypothetical protein
MDARLVGPAIVAAQWRACVRPSVSRLFITAWPTGARAVAFAVTYEWCTAALRRRKGNANRRRGGIIRRRFTLPFAIYGAPLQGAGERYGATGIDAEGCRWRSPVG